MKKKVVQAVLSMVVSFTMTAAFIAGSVQAKEEVGQGAIAGRAVNEECKYQCIGKWTEYEEANSAYHFEYTCEKNICTVHYTEEIIYRTQTGYDPHDFSETATPPNRYRCVLCGYEEW